jgi:hypothetical protein
VGAKAAPGSLRDGRRRVVTPGRGADRSAGSQFAVPASRPAICALDGKYHPAVGEFWDPSAPGILRLPSGRLVRGRGLSRPLPDGPYPAFGVYLLGQPPPDVPWESRWLRWPDFRLPADRADVLPALTEAWQRAATERVEIACAGGRGRTGTALACMAILDGVPASKAVAFIREHYSRHAVETLRQRRYVARWRGRQTM